MRISDWSTDVCSSDLFVSEAEAALIRAGGGKGRVVAIENGIDTVRFDPGATFDSVETQRALIVFTGQMDYRPNVEAVRWFAEVILPRIRTSQEIGRATGRERVGTYVEISVVAVD